MTFIRLPFEQVFADESGGNIKTPQSDYLAEGRYPVVDQGKSLIGGYINDPSRLCGGGRPAIVFGDHTRCIKYVDMPFCMGADGVKVLRPKIDADLKFLYHYLQTVKIPSAGYDRHYKYLKRTEVVVPPLPEQRRIAAILDKADALRAKRRAALAQLDELTQSIFIEMFAQGLDGPVVDVAQERLGIQEGWSWGLLTDVARLATGHTPDRECEQYWNGDIPWISLTDIRGLDGTVATRTHQHVTEEGLNNSSAVRLPKGTVCFSRTASVGFVTVMGRDMATSQDFVNWVCGPKILPTYLMWALLSARHRLRALSSGSTHRTIYMRVVETFNVLIPPLPVQNKFVDIVDKLTRTKSTNSESLLENDVLFAALQHRAFRGEL